jgi:hypothetical protein
LAVRLQDRHRENTARTEVTIEVGQVGDTADVGRLVEDHDHRRIESPTVTLRGTRGFAHDPVG